MSMHMWMSRFGLLACLLAIATSAIAQGSDLFGYRPPQRGAPSAASRVGGGTRGPAQEKLALSVLAPDHVGYTVRAQPELYWFVAEPVSNAVELVVADERGENPLLDVTLQPPIAPGIHAISLAERGVSLEPDATYQVFVAVVLDPDRRSLDIVSGGDIRRVSPSAELRARLSGADELTAARAYAEAGLWYDMMESIAQAIESRPEDPRRYEQRAALLEQVGLARAAAHQREQARAR
jgi:hypothetical protein